LSAVEQVGGLAEGSRTLVQRGLALDESSFGDVVLPLALVRVLVSLARGDVAQVGQTVALIGSAVSLVGDSLALIRDLIAIFRDLFAAIERRATFAGRGASNVPVCGRLSPLHS